MLGNVEVGRWLELHQEAKDRMREILGGIWPDLSCHGCLGLTDTVNPLASHLYVPETMVTFC